MTRRELSILSHANDANEISLKSALPPKRMVQARWGRRPARFAAWNSESEKFIADLQRRRRRRKYLLIAPRRLIELDANRPCKIGDDIHTNSSFYSSFGRRAGRQTSRPIRSRLLCTRGINGSSSRVLQQAERAPSASLTHGALLKDVPRVRTGRSGSDP